MTDKNKIDMESLPPCEVDDYCVKIGQPTPGPWRFEKDVLETEEHEKFIQGLGAEIDLEIDETYRMTLYSIYTEAGSPIVHTTCGPNGKNNAKLIAASPELLDALIASTDALKEVKAIIMNSENISGGHPESSEEVTLLSDNIRANENLLKRFISEEKK